ncbi:hypothetical protein EPA93_25760 [Ktedonosporobacter rubrisoli]|uniref:Protein kinase domain-containing protein n=1 Tax=Ktedonosporobacter rubrisoli TaxID=2509675 RepID=A0A4V0YZC1_KTERU|nr:protein kinase [Ktedonosporobacter rubrisoli]QBD79201.1 hypothetical protein EPA93_25760 [Ktedonosporobacter rubrisoli]
MSLEGSKLGHYSLLRLIGKGGMGEVYLAEDLYVKRQVAVKIIGLEHTTDLQEATRLFQREIQAISQLDHPHILPLFDSGEEVIQDRRLAYMVMPYRAEGSLQDWLSQQNIKQLAPHIVAHIVEQAAAALQHAHERQLIHQDVKPSNFLMRQRSEHPEYPDILLADFSIARFESISAMKSQQIRGTPAYMPPEQWQRHSTPASDQYALAITAYHLLVGHPPFSGRMEQVMHQHFDVQPQPPSTLNPHVTNALDAVILRALAKKPEERFPSVLQFAQAFQQAWQGQGDIYISLPLSSEEALHGAIRNVTLPGRRQISASIPPNSHNGDQIRLAELGEPYYAGGPRSAVILTLLVQGHTAYGINFPPDTDSLSEPTLRKTPSAPQIPPPPPYWSTQPITPPNTIRPRRLLTIVAVLCALALLISGTVGLFIYQNHVQSIQATATATALRATTTVSARQTSIAAMTATVTTGNHYPSYMPDNGQISFYDPMTDPKDKQWSEDRLCYATQDGYHVLTNQAHYYRYCSSANTYADFAFEVQMKIVKGDCGGLEIRNDGQGKAYQLVICANGAYGMYLYVDLDGAHAKTLLESTSALIHAEAGKLNTIGVVAKGPDIRLFVNGYTLGHIQDNTYQKGYIGLLATAYDNPSEVVYQNARIWIF